MHTNIWLRIAAIAVIGMQLQACDTIREKVAEFLDPLAQNFNFASDLLGDVSTANTEQLMTSAQAGLEGGLEGVDVALDTVSPEDIITQASLAPAYAPLADSIDCEVDQCFTDDQLPAVGQNAFKVFTGKDADGREQTTIQVAMNGFAASGAILNGFVSADIKVNGTSDGRDAVMRLRQKIAITQDGGDNDGQTVQADIDLTLRKRIGVNDNDQPIWAAEYFSKIVFSDDQKNQIAYTGCFPDAPFFSFGNVNNEIYSGYQGTLSPPQSTDVPRNGAAIPLVNLGQWHCIEGVNAEDERIKIWFGESEGATVVKAANAAVELDGERSDYNAVSAATVFAPFGVVAEKMEQMLIKHQTKLRVDTNSLDEDNDGLTNAQENKLGTDPKKPDTDGDGLRDGDEPSMGTDPTKADTDGDGLQDGVEAGFGTDPTKYDTDDDGISDGDEVLIYNFDPTQPNICGADQAGFEDPFTTNTDLYSAAYLSSFYSLDYESAIVAEAGHVSTQQFNGQYEFFDPIVDFQQEAIYTIRTMQNGLPLKTRVAVVDYGDGSVVYESLADEAYSEVTFNSFDLAFTEIPVVRIEKVADEFNCGVYDLVVKCTGSGCAFGVGP